MTDTNEFEPLKLMAPEDLALVVVTAQELREESWDGSRYLMEQSAAARKACEAASFDVRWAVVVELLNIACANDAQIWANETLEGTRG